MSGAAGPGPAPDPGTVPDPGPAPDLRLAPGPGTAGDPGPTAAPGTRSDPGPARRDAAPAARFPWADLRLWASAAFAAGLAAVANVAWRAAIPGRAAPTPAVAAAASVVALTSMGLALHPRLAPWVVRAGRTVPVPSVALSAALAPPRLGPAFWTFVWTLAVLMWVWLVVDRLAAALVGAMSRAASGPAGGGGRRWGLGRGGAVRVGDALLGPLGTLGLWIAACDLALRDAAGGWTGARLWTGALVAATCLLLASWWARAAAVRRAREEGATLAAGFAAQWWWAAVPAVAVCVLAAALWPRYPAPLQGGGLQRLVLAYVGRLGTPPADVAQGEGGGTALLLLLSALAAALAWPGRGLVQRAARRVLGRAAPLDRGEAITLRLRLLGWWDRLRGLLGILRPRGRAMRHGTWRPLAPTPPPRRAPAPTAVPSPLGGSARARVRAAYAQFLREASAAGLRRPVADTPRRYLRWLVPRAAPARFPLESLTDTYEEARFSAHDLAEDVATRAEGDVRAALYGVRLALRQRAGRTGDALRWTPPRGVSRNRRER